MRSEQPDSRRRAAGSCSHGVGASPRAPAATAPPQSLRRASTRHSPPRATVAGLQKTAAPTASGGLPATKPTLRCPAADGGAPSPPAGAPAAPGYPPVERRCGSASAADTAALPGAAVAAAWHAGVAAAAAVRGWSLQSVRNAWRWRTAGALLLRGSCCRLCVPSCGRLRLAGCEPPPPLGPLTAAASAKCDTGGRAATSASASPSERVAGGGWAATQATDAPAAALPLHSSRRLPSVCV